MIKIRFCCAMCGKHTGEFELERWDSKPHFRAVEFYVKCIVEKAGWIFEDDACGDIYCSKKCANGDTTHD